MATPTAVVATILPGYCQCGCGQRTRIAKRTDRKRGWVKGKPRRFLPGHNTPRKGLPIEGEHYRVDPETGCWIWLKSRVAGYGWLHRLGRRWRAHRFMYEQLVGSIPEGLVLDHLCGQPLCVNPAHLEPVTHAENCRRGEKAKLTMEDVVAIRSSIDTSARVAAQFGVGESTVREIRLNKRWRDIGV